MNVFFDQDGVLGIYERDAYIGKDPIWKKPGSHYFSTVKPDHRAISLFNLLTDAPNVNTFVLTAINNIGPIYLEQIKDKIAWLKEHIPAINIQKQFIPCVSPKSQTIQAVISQTRTHMKPSDILIDDYNPNLNDWTAAGGTALKYCNGLNSEKSYKGISLPENMTSEEMTELICTIDKTALFNFR